MLSKRTMGRRGDTDQDHLSQPVDTGDRLCSVAAKDVVVGDDTFARNIAALHEKRASTREEALAALIGAMEGFVPAHDVEERYGRAILGRFNLCIMKGSTVREVCLALRAVSLLAVTLGAGAGSQKIMAESYPLLFTILEASSDADAEKVIAALDCLAVVAFVGAASLGDTEASLKAMWGVMCPRSGRKVAGVARKTASPQVLAAAVSAWTFVLTTIGGWKLKPAKPGAWNDTTAFLATLLYADDRAVRMAAGEALAVCVELKLLSHKNGTLFSDMVARVGDLAIEAAGKGADKNRFLEQKNLFRKLSAFMARGEPPEKSVRTSSSERGLLTVTTWSNLTRLNFLARFLGAGFLHHLQGHGHMRQVFDIKDDEVTGKLAAACWKRSLQKDTRIMRGQECTSMDKKKNKERIKNKLEKQCNLNMKKDRRIADEIKHGFSCV